MKRDTLNYELFGSSDGGTTFDIKSNPIPKNEVLCLQRVACTNETSNTCTATVGVLKNNKPYWFETLTLTTANLYYSLKEPVFITGGDRVVVRFRSTSSADKLRAFAYGYYEYK